MARLKAVYRCQECGQDQPKWAGQCPGCGAWNSLVEEAVEARAGAAAASGTRAPRPLTDFSSEAVPLSQVSGAEEKRRPTGLPEFDRLLGGGLVAGQVCLLAGPPGIGKSTLMLQVAECLAARGRVLYVTGEESPAQVSGRAKRLKVAGDAILLMAETDLTKIVAALEVHKPAAVVLDSIQTVYHPELSGGPGTVGQVRECAAELLRAVKKSGAVLFILGHVTKEGSVAGPKVLEHLVDTVLQFDAEMRQDLRVLRSEKNRFGPADELGFFEMSEAGLRGVADAASFFIEDRGGAVAGRAISVALEGSRPILAEVQALVTPTRYPLPRRMATGLDLNRVLVLLAALEKHLHLRLETRDVYVSVAGGLRLRDPALDLAICLAVASSAREEALPADWVFVGEVGLLGRLGRVGSLGGRLKEAARAGFKSALLPARSVDDLGRAPLSVKAADDLAAAAAAAFANSTPLREDS
ncbi:MAG: DNA repair protein RadA [Elusimicrobia bacterium]|nr:DNA repair protein RadA [Elusimicrobiota bacterium]